MNRREAALTITLTGPGIGEGRLALAELVHVGRNLQAALERIALVLRGEATSLKPGRRPADVTGLCRFDLVGFRGGSAVLELELAGAERPFEIMDLGEAALDRMVEGLQRVSEGPSLPPGWDTGVLVAWRELGSIFDRGVDHIEVARAKRTGVSVVRYTPAVRDQIVQRIRGPMHDLLTVEGRLLMADFDEAHRRCRVHPSYGPPVACIFREDQREAILDLLTKYVRVVGQAERDEEHGRVRVVTISDIEPIEVPGDPGGADFWEHPSVEELAQRQAVRPVERPEDLAADVWESDSELEEFLADTYQARATGSR
jgi:hypothetical protein